MLPGLQWQHGSENKGHWTIQSKLMVYFEKCKELIFIITKFIFGNRKISAKELVYVYHIDRSLYWWIWIIVYWTFQFYTDQ